MVGMKDTEQDNIYPCESTERQRGIARAELPGTVDIRVDFSLV